MSENMPAGSVMPDVLEGFFKALADSSRLRIIGLLGTRPHKVGELAQALGLTEPTVSHHLARLREAWLVNLRAEGTTRIYSLRADMLETMLRHALDFEELARLTPTPKPDMTWVDALALSEAERKVFRDYFHGRQLKQIPTKQAKLLVILRWLAEKFAPGVQYTEAEVNAILKTVHPDYARLRRELVNFKLLAREGGGGLYWRVAGPPEE
jgi:hypothetical protein